MFARWIFVALGLAVAAPAWSAAADSTGGFLDGRYGLSPSAMPFERGDHVAVVRPFGVEAHFALADRVRLGVLSSWLVSPVGASLQVGLSHPASRVHLAASGRVANGSYLNDFESTTAFATLHATVGSPGRHATLSLGYGGSNIEQPYTYYSAYTDVLVSPTTEDPRRPYRQQGRRRVGGWTMGLACLTPLTDQTQFVLDGAYLLDPAGEYVSLTTLHSVEDFGSLLVYESCTVERRPIHSFALTTGLRFRRSPHHTLQVTVTALKTTYSLPLNFLPIPLLPMTSWQITF